MIKQNNNKMSIDKIVKLMIKKISYNKKRTYLD